MSESNYVKCEDCGRRVSGSPGKCDVCGGKMTRRAENSYYTPEGVVNKRSYGKSQGTPDGESISARRSSKSQTSSEGRIGFLKKTEKSSRGDKSAWINIFNENADSDDDNNQGSYSDHKKKLVIKYTVGIIIFILAAIGFASDFGNDDDYDDDYYDDYGAVENFDIYKKVSGNGYILDLQYIMFSYDKEDKQNNLYASLVVEITDDNDIEVQPYNCMGIEFDGNTVANLDYIDIYDDNVDESDIYYSADEDKTKILKSGETYSVILNYNDVPEWNELNFIHNFKGSLFDRDTKLDIAVYRDE